MLYAYNLFIFTKILQCWCWYHSFYLKDGDQRALVKRSVFVVVVDSRLAINSGVSQSRAGVQLLYYWGGGTVHLCCKFNAQWKTKLFRAQVTFLRPLKSYQIMDAYGNGCLYRWKIWITLRTFSNYIHLLSHIPHHPPQRPPPTLQVPEWLVWEPLF